MFTHSYIAKIGFVKTLDRTCPTHGGMYSSQERNICPKCNAALIAPMTKGDNPRPYLMTEIHIYPQERQDHQEDHKRRSAASGGLEFEIRFILWGRWDAERQMIFPDNRVQYLAPKRLIHVEFNKRPIIRPFVSAKEGNKQKLEFKYHFDGRAGDKLKFLDSKETFEALTGQTTTTAQASAQGDVSAQSSAQASPAEGVNSNQPSNADIMAALTGMQNRLTALENGSVQNNVPEDVPDTPPEDMDLNETGLVNDAVASAGGGLVDPFKTA